MTYNPYRSASEEIQRQEGDPLNYLQKGLSISAAVGGLGGLGALSSKILPLLNSRIPESIAVKGINKINPSLGRFVESATNFGYDFEEVRNFLRNKAAEQQDEKVEPKQNRNIIQQYSPDLHEFILTEIKKGRSPLEAGALASLSDAFKSVINKLTKDYSSPFSALLETVYGPSEKKQAQPRVSSGQQDVSAQAGLDRKENTLAMMRQITEALRGLKGNG